MIMLTLKYVNRIVLLAGKILRHEKKTAPSNFKIGDNNIFRYKMANINFHKSSTYTPRAQSKLVRKRYFEVRFESIRPAAATVRTKSTQVGRDNCSATGWGGEVPPHAPARPSGLRKPSG